MIQKYCAIHSTVFMVVCLLVNLTITTEWGVGIDNFESVITKTLFVFALVAIVAPLFIVTFGMLFNTISNKKWLWFFAIAFMPPIASVLYYFLAYEESSHLTSKGSGRRKRRPLL
ncbi:hypothetical protein KFE80_05325 [bacterium SCSIO 12696]|nr:hypothetical protein KFE80_05325 [bacterium SCSIO 12696]